ncbi:UDP-glucose 4-epimerase [Allgaiera indica]|uniref:UDP-glucose 4-epimerase n=1 Tax=Allgaiera indica TaxID=765699 RepID=A0AAN4UUM2_9RHOB|nr:UDP-glucose 4-epimerase GalE [Allgaiera indica]GHE05751.1 UDP-glucose 4-epimerase [Allgaiera indica]SDX79089.1 UDP-galactose 4-epimerase [Allgaiera indica]
MRKTILLTGGAGYIGSHTYVALVQAGYEVVILDNFSNARADVPDRLEVITGAPVTVHRADVLDKQAVAAVFAAHKIDAVVHFAARKAVGESQTIPLEYIETNCTGLVNLLMTMRDAGVFRIVFSSSATVYAETEDWPIPEEAELGYASTYALTKLMGEQIIRQVAGSDARWRHGILRYFNPAGAHESALIGEDPRDIPNNLMPYIAKVAVGELPTLNVFGDDYPTPDGTGVRDYIHVMDLAEGHVKSLDALMAGAESHIVNLGTGKGYSVLDMLASYSKACGRDLPYRVTERRAGDLACYFGDPAKAKALLGFQARRDLDDMCRSSWAWISRRSNMRGA